MLEESLGKFVASLEAESVEADAHFDRVSAMFAAVSWAVGLGGLVLSVVAGGLLSANINRRLRHVTEELKTGAAQVVSAAGQVSASSQALSQGASEQAASLEQTTASMAEVASLTRSTDENAQQAARLMAQTGDQVATANAALADMESSMAAIKESSAKVSRIIKTIDEIAFQTNLLALNAAVEAARAGEAGKGFAVVAEEVRNLAQRAGVAARDTTDLIEESLVRSGAGEATVANMSRSIAAITDSATTVGNLVGEVSAAARRQTQGIAEISRALGQMDKTTQSAAATAEQTAAASEELNSQAETSQGLVADLEQLVGGAAG